MLRNYIFLSVIVLYVICFFPTTPPRSFPSGSIVTIEEGLSLYELGEILEKGHVIRSPFWFRTVSIILGGEYDMKAGQYLMPEPESVFLISWRVFHGDYKIETVKLTIPEGFTIEKISALFDERFTFFDHGAFVAEAREGYLFPDTYFFEVTATASSSIKLLTDNFSRKISIIRPEIESSGLSLEKIITMASLLEAEAKTKEEREIASGILWKRLKLGMPLQVDSETGTYKFIGLPESPINNPGLVSIIAALHPTSTPYLYFLTDKDGTMHYAKTFDEHKKNIIKYLSH